MRKGKREREIGRGEIRKRGDRGKENEKNSEDKREERRMTGKIWRAPERTIEGERAQGRERHSIQ